MLVKVMTYNIRHGVGDDGVLNLYRIGNVIVNSGAQVIGLQEVDRNWSERSNFEDQAKWLADYLGMEFAYIGNLDKGGSVVEGEPHRQYGLAILSAFPIESSKKYFLTSDREQRGLLEVRITINENKFYFFNTHLGLSTEERKVQVNEVLEIIGKRDKPTILVGDFNAEPDSVELGNMLANYKSISNEKTFSSISPDRKIDYLLTSKEIEPVQTRIIETLASDHLPIYAELELKY